MKEKCFYKNGRGFCKHKQNNQQGQPLIKCYLSECPYKKIGNNI